MRKVYIPKIEIHELSDVGRRRHENQDSVARLLLEKIPYQGGHLLVVADGMGGASGGQTASRLAVKHVISYFEKDPHMEPDVALREAIEHASEAILERARQDPGNLAGMGTTCVSCIVHNGYLFASHVGDSRLYLWRDGRLHRLSRDHSAVQRLVEAGILTEEEARNHPRQNVLSRVLGSEFPLYVEVLAPPWKLREGDRLLLCSDGLHGEVSDEKIAEVLATNSAKDAVETLILLANQSGGNDNITAQVLAYGDIPNPIPVLTPPTSAIASIGPPFPPPSFLTPPPLPSLSPAPPPPAPPPAPVETPITEGWFATQNPLEGALLSSFLLLCLFLLGYIVGLYQAPSSSSSSYSRPLMPYSFPSRLPDPSLESRTDVPPPPPPLRRDIGMTLAPPRTQTRASATPQRDTAGCKDGPQAPGMCLPPTPGARTSPPDSRTSPQPRLRTLSPDVRLTPPKPDVRLTPPKPDVRLTPPKPDVRLTPPKPDVRLTPPKPDVRLTPPATRPATPPKPDVRLTPPATRPATPPPPVPTPPPSLRTIPSPSSLPASLPASLPSNR